jgi:toxin ParE1/3/4
VYKLVYLNSARRDILSILDYTTCETGSLMIAQKLTNAIRDKCKKLASLSGTLGRARPELLPEIRSFPFKSYVIFFRYCANTLEIVNVMHGHRDIEHYYNDTNDSS